MKLRCVLGLLALASVAVAPAQDDVAEAEADLARVRTQIEGLELDIQRHVEQRSAAEQSLRRAEVAEAEARLELQDIRSRRAAARKRVQDLRAQAESTRMDLAARAAELASQVRLAYITGQEEWLRLVLSQRNPATVGRRLVYYGYVTRQRSALMELVRDRLRQLETTVAEVDREEQELLQLAEAQQARVADLGSARKDRRLALARLDEDIASRETEIQKFRDQAAELEALVAELIRLLASLPAGDATPFAEMKGRLAWPTEGELAKTFGESRADGHLRWEGVLVTATAGTEVRAVHHGRVVFADWLPGMGLLMVIEHGDGYLSLYGHNQDLLKDVGDWVSASEVVAHIGDSGGQAMPGLYFEIRKDGRPLDPLTWLP